MNPFRKWFRRGSADRDNQGTEGPDAVLNLLIETVGREDTKRFVSLCQQHAPVIVEHFVKWRTMPEAIRGDPEQVAQRARTLLRTAQLFEQSGYPDLMAMLVGNDEDNPLIRWNRSAVEVQRLANVDPGKGLAAAAALLASLEDSGVSGPGLLSSRAKVRGLQAMMLTRLGRNEEARAATEAALTECEQAGDLEGVDIYRRNLATLDSQQPTVTGLIEREIELLEQMRLAQRRTDLRRYQASNQLLEKLLATSGEAAPVVGRLRPHLLGRIGFNEFKLGHLDAARDRVRAARDACRAAHDDEGVEVYEENLAVLDRSRLGATDNA